MQKLTYTNRPLSLDEQIQLLKSRGLQIEDETFAKHQLQIISYFRLARFPNVDISAMGFPENWQDEPLWK